MFRRKPNDETYAWAEFNCKCKCEMVGAACEQAWSSEQCPDLGGVTLEKLIDFFQGRAPVPIPADGVGVVRDHRRSLGLAASSSYVNRESEHLDLSAGGLF